MDKIYNTGLYKLDKVPEAEGLHLPRDLTPEFIMETLVLTIWISYKEEYLKDNIEIALLFTYNSPDIVISETIELSDTARIVLRSNYNHSNKKLLYNQIAISIWSDEIGKFKTYKDEENINKYLEEYNVIRQDVEVYREYAVYDTVVKTWIKANGGIYPLEWLKLKACTIDNTFSFEE